MHVQHQSTERCSQIVGQFVILHTSEYQVGVQVTTEGVDGEILPVQTHVGEQVQLVPVVVQDQAALLVPLLPTPGQLAKAPLELVLVPAEYDVLCVDRDHLEGRVLIIFYLAVYFLSEDGEF